MKNKKGLIIGLVILLVMVIIIVTVITLNLNKENPEDVLNTYIAYINDKNYDGMYELLSSSSKSSISKEDFITKNKNIYESKIPEDLLGCSIKFCLLVCFSSRETGVRYR